MLSSCVRLLDRSLAEFDRSLSSWHVLQLADAAADPHSCGPRLLSLLDPATYHFEAKKLLTAFMPDSRAWLHTEVDQWFHNQSQRQSQGQNLEQRLFWLRAGAGMGKSVFTASLLARMKREYGARVLGCVFFSFNYVRKADPLVMLRSLVYQLALAQPTLGEFILQAVSDTARETQKVMLLFEEVLLAALLKLEADSGGAAQMPTMPTMLIMVDALGEAGAEGSKSRWALLDLFSTKLIRQLPPWVKLFVTGHRGGHRGAPGKFLSRDRRARSSPPAGLGGLRFVQHRASVGLWTGC